MGYQQVCHVSKAEAKSSMEGDFPQILRKTLRFRLRGLWRAFHWSGARSLQLPHLGG